MPISINIVTFILMWYLYSSLKLVNFKLNAAIFFELHAITLLRILVKFSHFCVQACLCLPRPIYTYTLQ
jgi:hypothetical protein